MITGFIQSPWPVFQMAESIRARSWFPIPLDSSVGTKALIQVEDGDFRLAARFLEYRNSTVLPRVCMHAKSLQLCLILVILCTIPPQAPMSMGFSRQGNWSRLLVPPSRESSQPRDQTHIFYVYLHWQEGSLPLVPPGKSLCYLTTSQSEESLHTVEDNEDSDLLPKWFSL